MIKLNKQQIPPKVLQDNVNTWTTTLMQAVQHYGSYDKIPETERNSLINHYRHKEIKDMLLESSNNKCAFCESVPSESSYVEIEHFAPKSIYPARTFDWNNLLPSCKRCNLGKLALDTVNKPIVNPYLDDPEKIFVYDFLCIKPNPSCDKGDMDKANRTKDELGLNHTRLTEPRSRLLVQFYATLNTLKEKVDELKKAKQYANKIKKANALSNAIDTIETLSKEINPHSGLIKFLLTHEIDYINAKSIVYSILNSNSSAVS